MERIDVPTMLSALANHQHACSTAHSHKFRTMRVNSNSRPCRYGCPAELLSGIAPKIPARHSKETNGSHYSSRLEAFTVEIVQSAAQVQGFLPLKQTATERYRGIRRGEPYDAKPEASTVLLPRIVKDSRVSLTSLIMACLSGPERLLQLTMV